MTEHLKLDFVAAMPEPAVAQLSDGTRVELTDRVRQQIADGTLTPPFEVQTYDGQIVAVEGRLFKYEMVGLDVDEGGDVDEGCRVMTATVAVGRSSE